MKTHIFFLVCLACFQKAMCFMSFKDFQDSKLKQCYDSTIDTRNPIIVNGQALPLPSSLESFASLVERLEIANPGWSAADMVKKLLSSFRINDLPSGLRRIWGPPATYLNELEKAFFNIPKVSIVNNFKEDDLSSDEECALHFMMSHSVNQSLKATGDEETITEGVPKHPREFGVVSLNGRGKHAFALDRVLLGILAGLSGSSRLDAQSIFGRLKPSEQDQTLAGIMVNRLHAVTFGGIVSVTINEDFKRGSVTFQPNGAWNDVSCTTEYSLEDNVKQYVTNSLVRGSIDGLIIGNALEKNQESQKLRLSQILRMYYGPEGLTEDGRKSASGRGDIQWCNRKNNFDRLTSQLREEMVNFNKLYSSYMGSYPSETASDEIGDVINHVQSLPAILADMEQGADCIFTDSNSLDKKCATPFDVFPIIDINAAVLQKSFQIEVLGNLSLNLDVRPRGNSVGAYSNMRPLLGRGLDTIANNSGIAGCPSCFVRYYARRSNRLDDVEVMERINQTLTDFVEEYDERLDRMDESDIGANSKVVLLFNYQSQVNNDQRLRDAVWELQKSFREVTVLAVGSKKDNLEVFTLDDKNDVFTESSNAAEFVTRLKSRICKVPAEFQYKDCFQNSRSSGKIDAFISVGKLQYWAMYPKYFEKSLRITMKFIPLDGAQIRVCFSRSYDYITDANTDNYCKDSSSEEISFYVKNPCHRRNVHNCDPFYFSVEGKKLTNGVCESPRCRTMNDIQFEFQHEGISCNTASLVSLSSFCMLVVAITFLLRRL